MDKYSKAVLADAKQEYTQQLTTLLIDPVYKGLRSIYDKARETSASNNLNTLKTFQLLLSKTPKWNDEKINIEVSRLKKVTDCDYLEDLVTAVFVTHTKILIAIKAKNKTDTIDLNVPKINYFIHMIYIQCARNFWKQPWLFHTGYNSLDLQRNMIKAEQLIKSSIIETIRKLLPVKDILRQYLGNNFIDQDFNKYAEEDITSTVSEQTKTTIRKLLKHELDNNLKTVSETNDFAKVTVSAEKKIDYNNLSPENFDNQTVEEDIVIENDTTTQIEETLNKQDTATQIEETLNKQDTATQIEETLNKQDTATQTEEIIEDQPEDSVSETETVIENLSVLNDTTSTDTNMDNNFSFFEDAANF